MSVTVISMWHNEGVLAPLFLLHYRWADRIIVLVDCATDDDTWDALRAERQRRGVDLSYSMYAFPDGLDDERKAAALTELARNCTTDWVLCVDADEFAFASGEPIPCVLRRHEQERALGVSYRTVYRHRTDSDLNLAMEPLEQREHGNPTKGTSYGQQHFTKPAFVRPSPTFRWAPGHHYAEGVEWCFSPFDGAHWCMADPDLAVRRRLSRKARMSKNNYQKGLTVQHWHVTEEEIRAECAAHLDDPRIIAVESGVARAL